MAEFRWGPSEESEEKTAGSTLDVLISAAGGDPLPGIFGLLQAIFNVWTTSPPMPGSSNIHWLLWGGRSTLNTLGVIRSYQRAVDTTWSSVRKDVVDEFIADVGIQTFPELTAFGIMIHVYAEVLKHEDRMLGAAKDTCIRCFRLPSGVEFFYIFRHYAATSDFTARHSSWGGDGPYLRSADYEKFLQGIGELIWEAEGKADLQLTVRGRGVYERDVLAVSNIGPPDDYVSEGSVVANVERLAIRCQALMRKGFTRKILFAGPPGCGKSTLARNLARNLGGGHALRIHPEVVEQYSVEQIMRFVRLLSPRVILFDDLDRNKSDTVKILHYMESAGNVSWTRGVVVIGTVNTLSTLDPALLRPGRFDEIQFVEEPSNTHRVHIIEHYLEKFDVRDLDAVGLSAKMDQFSGADIQEVLKVVSAIGSEHIQAEVDRVRLQRGLYAGKSVELFLRKKDMEAEDD